jgi:hypothetical protein
LNTFNIEQIPYDYPFVLLITAFLDLILEIDIEIPPPYLLIKAQSYNVLKIP